MLYLDANNLYGYAMQQKLPYKGHKFLNNEEKVKIDTDFILNYDNGDLGYVLEVDLVYP